MIDIGAGIPTATAIHTNTHALARYAALCQAAQIVPIVEPEVLMDGDHDIDRCFEVTTAVLKAQFEELYRQRVALEGIVLKPNMAISGKKSAKRAGVEEVAEKTVKMLKNCVPGAVPGIAFLSGGQSDEEATAHLDTMNKIGNLPWNLTFSYGRALQARAAEGVVGQVRERRRRPARLRAPRAHERPRLARPVEAGPGEEGGLTRPPTVRAVGTAHTVIACHLGTGLDSPSIDERPRTAAENMGSDRCGFSKLDSVLQRPLRPQSRSPRPCARSRSRSTTTTSAAS